MATAAPASLISDAYAEACRRGDIVSNPEQRVALTALDTLTQQLIQKQQQRWWQRRHTVMHGIYLWGDTGRGKTWLMDLFFRTLPITAKQRLHFHAFMLKIHAERHTLGNKTRDPLRHIVDRLARHTRILCLDEFHVQDIGDAMLLSGLLHALFDAGIALVTTANTPPEDLYRYGLQRQRFLPAITLINARLTVINVDGAIDFRTGNASVATSTSQLLFARYGNKVTIPLIVHKRSITYQERREHAVWLSLDVACGVPRAAVDYYELTQQFAAIFIDQLYPLDDEYRNIVSNFIKLIDICYDNGILLYLDTAITPDNLYTGSENAVAFQRTRSRLHWFATQWADMQRHEQLQ